MSIIDNHVIEKQLEKQLQEYYCHDKEPQAIIINKDYNNLLVRVFFDNDLFNTVSFDKTKENKILIGKIVSNRIKRIFDLIYYSENITSFQFSFHYDESNSFLTLVVKDNIENIENLIEKLFNAIIIVLSKNTILCDEDIELYNQKRSILDAFNEFSLIKLAYDIGIDDGEYYDSDLSDLVLIDYQNNIDSVFLFNDKTLTIEDFKTFCLLLDKEYNIIIGGRQYF